MSTEFWRGRKTPIYDTPVDGAATPISANWAYDHAAAANPHNTALSDVSDHVLDQAQQILHGFPNRTDTTLSFDNSSHVLTLGVATTATIYINGIAYTISNPGLTIDLDTKTLANGLWYIWAEISGGVPVLNAAQAAWNITNLAAIPVATVYWNGSAGAVSDERHSATRNLTMHKYLHKTVGARIQNDGSFAQTRPTTVNDAQIELVAGTLWDEDINNEITTAQGKLCRLWYETASNTWTFSDGTDNSGYDRPFLWNSGTSRLRYPKSNSSYALNDASATDYLAVWVYATNDITRPIYIVIPSMTNPHSTIPASRAATVPAVPFAEESKLLYRWIFRGDGEYQEASDYRTASSLPSGGVASPTASSVTFAPSGALGATNVQAAIEELDTEKLAASDGTLTNYKETLYATTTAGNVTINLANGNIQRFILDAARQFTMPADPGAVGQSFVLILECATYTPTWNSSPTIEWLTSDGNAPTLVTSANLVNVLTFIWDDVDTRWLGFLSGKET